MSQAIYNLLDDVKGEAYLRLLHHALSYCDSFILVIRHSIDVNPSAAALLNRLEPSLISSEESSEWPGTQLLDDTAQVNTYKLSPNTAADLAEVADSLFSWCQPELPSTRGHRWCRLPGRSRFLSLARLSLNREL